MIEDNFKLFKLIKDQNVYKNAELQLFFHPANYNSKLKPVVVDNVSHHDTIEKLKTKYYEKTPEEIQKVLTVNDIRMQYPVGTFLENDRKVKDYKIENDDTIHVHSIMYGWGRGR